jgi:D-arabinose 1-dehydrogenase-like Zn-dependent alcohol dehydrogenase
VEIHEPKQGLFFVAVPLCSVCHRDNTYGWHGARQNWKVRKMDQLDAINATIRLLMEDV